MIKIKAKTVPAQPRNKKWLTAGKGTGASYSGSGSVSVGGSASELTAVLYSDVVYDI